MQPADLVGKLLSTGPHAEGHPSWPSRTAVFGALLIGRPTRVAAS